MTPDCGDGRRWTSSLIGPTGAHIREQLDRRLLLSTTFSPLPLSVRRTSAGPATLRTVRTNWPVAVAATVLLAGCTWPGSGPSTVPVPETLQVASVADGDTFTAIDAHGERVRVRLLGIDAPETAQDGQPADCGADEATEALRRLIVGRPVTLAGDPRADAVDRFGRHLAYATVDGQDVALALLREGMAAAWYPASEPEPTRYRDYLRLERAARATNVGLWARCGTVGR